MARVRFGPLGAGRARDAGRGAFTADEMRCIWLFNRTHMLRADAVRGDPPPADVRGMVLAMAHMAGWYPSKRRPLPGNEVLWRANRKLQPMVELLQALRQEGWLALPEGANPALA